MRRRVFAVLLFLCGSISWAVTNTSAAQESGPPSQTLSEPVVESDDALSTGQVTTWDCISFGTYPQTEIIKAPSDAVDIYAVQDGDYLEDPVLYESLEQTEWNENETAIDGVRYLRINQDDAVISAENAEGHYRWGSEKEWHYFRYDPIRWRVIGLSDGKAFLMADRLLDCQPFQKEDGPVTWENSNVRSWLNGLSGAENTDGIDYRGRGFIDKAFSDDEQQAIISVRVENKPNSRYGTECGNDTQDYIFLLSNGEVFGNDDAARNGFYASNGVDDPAKRFRSTMYAKCRGTWWSSVNGYQGNSFWFMRTNGYTPESVTYICDFGYIYARGTISTCEDAGILPAMWISLEKAQYEPAGSRSSKDILENAFSDTPKSDSKKDLIVNPEITKDPEQPDGKTVTYAMIRFGSYPQSEILPDTAGAGPDSIIDTKLYDALEHAEWTGDEWDYLGKTYLRVCPSDNEGNGKPRYFACEPILWRVLDVRDGTALLLSDSAIDCEPFQEELMDVSWENCTLRSYLNGYDAQENAAAIDYSGEKDNFLDQAFSQSQQEAIIDHYVRNENNYYFGVDSGTPTNDRIFLLAESELLFYDSAVNHGFSPRDEIADRAKQFAPTDYALMKGAWQDTANGKAGNTFWITRTTGYTHANVVYVDESGYMYNRGILVTCPDAGLIPALVLDLDTQEYEYAGTCEIGAQ